jgi:hypothetical protein
VNPLVVAELKAEPKTGTPIVKTTTTPGKDFDLQRMDAHLKWAMSDGFKMESERNIPILATLPSASTKRGRPAPTPRSSGKRRSNTQKKG